MSNSFYASEHGLILIASWTAIALTVLGLLAVIALAAVLMNWRWGFVKRMNLPERFGLRALWVFAALFSPIWLFLLVMVLFLLLRTFFNLPPFAGPEEEIKELRWYVLSVVGLLTTLAGLVATPLTLIRVFTTERQTKTAEQGLITDRINKAVEGLGTEKQVDRIGRSVTIVPLGQPESERSHFIQWQGDQDPEGGEEHAVEFGDWQVFRESMPNLEVRIGAIYALERIARDSLPDHVQIMEILCAYIRENAPASKARLEPLPDWEPLKDYAREDERAEHEELHEARFGGSHRDSQAWNRARDPDRDLKPRTDIQVALEVIGRRDDDQMLWELRTDNPKLKNDYRLDLRQTDLQRADLSGLHLDAALLTGARLKGSDLRETRLKGADLGEARLERANLREARLEGANLREARLVRANLGGARLEGANLREARLERAILRGALLEGANLGLAQMDGADLREAQMDRANLSRVRLVGANLGGAQIEGASFLGAQMDGAYLREARLKGTNLSWGLLKGANLSCARLEGANLSAARLEGTNLGGAQMEGADLNGAQLEGANLRDARLEGADLGCVLLDSKTNMTQVSLRGAAMRSGDYTNITITDAQLAELFGDASVTLPASASRPAHWPTFELGNDQFPDEWRKWQADPENYVPPAPPE